jgi:hypothetical protein
VKTKIIPDGQISIFDVNITEKPKKITEKQVFSTKKSVLDTKVDKVDTEHHEITSAQQNVINTYKTKNNLYRIIHYGGGGVGVELKNEDGFKTIYVNRQGIEEIKWDKQIRVLDMDKIIFTAEYEEVKENPINKVKIGDYIKAYYSKNEVVEGTITHIYGIANECLCISFIWNGKKSSTAIPRLNVIEVMKAS